MEVIRNLPTLAPYSRFMPYDPMVVLGGLTVSYERGTPVAANQPEGGGGTCPAAPSGLKVHECTCLRTRQAQFSFDMFISQNVFVD